VRQALELGPQDGWAHIEWGILCLGQGRLSEAVAEFERAIAKDPNNGWVHCQLGRIYRGQGRSSEAEAALHKALEFDPKSEGARVELGSLFLDQDRFSEAAAEFEDAIARDPDNGRAYGQLGRIYRRQGLSSKADAALCKALELNPEDSCARIELGALYEDQGRLPEAEAALKKAIVIDGDNGMAHYQLGRIHCRQGRSSEAEKALVRALELAPRNEGARIELGSLYLDQGRLFDAAVEFERAIAMDPDNGVAHCQLGRACRMQGLPSEAEAALRKALELDPENCCACIELGALHEDQSRFLEAEAEFEKAVAIDPHNAGGHLYLGRIHLRRERWSKAEAGFQKAAALDPRNEEAYIGLWAVYRGQGRSADAAAAMAKALAMNPDSVSAGIELLDRLDCDRAVGDCAGEQMQERVFCLLPWTHLHVRPDGTALPCCLWKGPPLGNVRSSSIAALWNAPTMKALRSDMVAGRAVVGCWRCYEDERSGLGSQRQRASLALDRHRGRGRLTAPDGTLPRLPVVFLDFRFSNACNLRCRTCDPLQSSAWAAEARALGLAVGGGPIRKAYDDWDSLWRQLQPLLEEGVEEIRFAGGEPLVMEEHYRILDFLIARGLTDVRLSYNTNFSTLRFQGRDLIDLWSRFRQVYVGASLDGSGRRGEYLRKGLRWDAVVANREEMLRRCPDVGFSIAATVSIFNVLHLPDFHREWVEKGYIDHNNFELNNVLVSPAMYRMQILPPALKERVQEAYRRHRESFLDADGRTARDFAAVARLMETRDRSELLPEFVAMTRRLDQLRGEDCREVFPELTALFEDSE